MSTLVTLTRNAETVQGFQIQASTDMVAALTYLATLAIPYSGTMSYQLSGSTYVWTLTLQNSREGASLTPAFINDWIILENNSVASVCPAANFATFYAQS